MTEIKKFVRSLQRESSTDTVFNMYTDQSIAENLYLYLEQICAQQGRRILLVGEAPGYRGCRITGIPSTSGRIFLTSTHPLIQFLAPKITLTKIESENTAKIVWDYLSTVQITPLFWNAFPFHPHKKDAPMTNRKPTQHEIGNGAVFLKQLFSIYQPDRVAGIGRIGTICAQNVFPELDITYIRHPSQGGKTQFIEGMNCIINHLTRHCHTSNNK